MTRLTRPHLTRSRLRTPHIPLPHLPLPRFAVPRVPLPRFPLPHFTVPRLPLPHVVLPRPTAPDLAAALRARRPLAVAGAGVLAVALLGAGLAFGNVLATPTPSATPEGPTPSPSPTENPYFGMQPEPTAGPTATPYPADVAATTNGVLLPWYEAERATRRPVAVMLDDHWAARPQAGTSQADIVYQALAEGGIPRYMAVFQTQDPPLIGPIRSARLYFVAWAEEWQAMYIHVIGSPNAMARLAQDHKIYLWNADGYRYLATRYMWRVDWRKAPHNAYTDGANARALLQKMGGTGTFPNAIFTFGDPTPEWLRPVGGTITIPYYYNQIEYRYDRASNTYLRWATYDVIRHKLSPDVDYNNGRQLAPSVVVVLYMDTYALANTTAPAKHRLDIRYVGKGKALVFQNGTVTSARWVRSKEHSVTTIRYVSGPDAGKPVPFNRGQIFVQVVSPAMPVTYTLGTTVAPEY